MAASGAGPTDGAGEAIAIRPLAPADVSEARRVEDAAYGAASPRTRRGAPSACGCIISPIAAAS